jgi:hypothetical protein
MGAHVAIIDVQDMEALRNALAKTKRLFLLNPPADSSDDTLQVEHGNLKAILTQHSQEPVSKRSSPNRLMACSPLPEPGVGLCFLKWNRS